MPVETVLSGGAGIPRAGGTPRLGLASICVPIATHVPHAAGLAWGKKLKGEDVVAMAFFGDGATSEGSFHEGINFAAVMGAPAVFVCNNNQWAISTPVEAQTRAERSPTRRSATACPASASMGSTSSRFGRPRPRRSSAPAPAAGRRSSRPSIYRVAPHATADDPAPYIDPVRVEEER